MPKVICNRFFSFFRVILIEIDQKFSKVIVIAIVIEDKIPSENVIVDLV